jgi:hypothetical protein
MAKEFNAVSFLLRLLFALLLVFGTYNPTDFSYLSWVISGDAGFDPVTALVGVALLIAWIVFLRATFLSLGAAADCADTGPGDVLVAHPPAAHRAGRRGRCRGLTASALA